MHPKPDPANAGHIGAPIPGTVTAIAGELNAEVKKGETFLVMEAMKTQTTVYVPSVERHVQVGQTVEPKDLLLVLG